MSKNLLDLFLINRSIKKYYVVPNEYIEQYSNLYSSEYEITTNLITSIFATIIRL